MKPFSAIKSFLSNAFATFRRALAVRPRHVRMPADGLLADAVRLAELPSPVEREEPRIQLIVERLKRAGIPCRVDGDGNAIASFPSPRARDPRPILVHACVGTRRWHPLGSLARLDALKARGAGLADALPAAVLLALAETVAGGGFTPGRGLEFAFVARSPEGADGEAYGRLLDGLSARPEAGIGLRGTGLSILAAKPIGATRFSVSISVPAAPTPAKGASAARSAVSLAAELVGRLEGVRWDASGETSCRVSRVEAGSGFGRPPIDAEVEIELESADQNVLDLAAAAVRATAARTGEGSGAMVTVAEASRLPVLDIPLSAPLAALAKAAMKELKIRPTEASHADPAAFLSSRGIRAVSIGVSEAVEGFERDELEIASLGVGSRLAGLALSKAIEAFPVGAEP